MTFTEAVEQYVESLLTGDLMSSDEEEIDITSLVESWVLLKYTSDRIDKRLKALRKELLARVEEFGITTEKGGGKLTVDGTAVHRERRQAALPDEKGIKALLQEHGIKNDQAFSKVTKVVLDASKVKNLVDLGKLPEDKVEALRKVTWALRVKESYDLAEALDRMVGEEGEELVENAPRDKRSEAAGKRKGA